jgi:hypothetical protein
MKPAITTLALPCLAVLVACAGEQPPSEDARMVQQTCTVTRVEQVERESDSRTDSTFLMLVFRPNARGGHDEQTSQPVSVQVQVRRERVQDVQAKLKANPELVCQPEPGTRSAYRLQLP